MTYVNGRTIGTTAKLEENWANAVTKVSRWYNPSGKLIPKNKVPSLFKLVTKESIYIGDCLEEGTVSPEDTALIEMVSRSKWAAMCLGQKWLKQINVNPLIHYNEQGQANARPLPYDDQSETRYALLLDFSGVTQALCLTFRKYTRPKVTQDPKRLNEFSKENLPKSFKNSRYVPTLLLETQI